MRCPRCQTENREGRRFCGECGSPLSLACPACGFPNEPGEKFCGGCGQPLLPAQQAARFPSPQAYTPKHLAEKILTSKSALEGERKQVTVLFVDVSGFTSLSERLDPEDVHQLMTQACEQALTIAQAIGNPPQLWKTHAALGRLHAEIGKPQAAREAYHAAREVIDRISVNLRDPGLRAGLEGSPLIQEVYGLSRGTT